MKGFKIFILVFLTNSCYSQLGLDAYMQTWRNQITTKHANVGVSVRTIDGNQPLYDYNGQLSLVPASSLKLLTTLIAIEEIGKNKRYETYLAYDGQLDPDGTLQGNLYIIGSGDPTLGSDRIPGTPSRRTLLSNIYESINELGITCIDGNIVADESIFDAYPIAPSWQWNDLGNYYGRRCMGFEYQ